MVEKRKRVELAFLLIATPLMIQSFLIFFIAYLASMALKLPHDIAVPAGMIGASNFFELAVAVAISLFGIQSPAAPAIIVGVLTEVPVMRILVRIANNTKGCLSMSKPKVAFICVHNSCRSQIAEALGKHFAADAFESYSAGTEQKDRMNPDAVRLVKERYGIDMELNQRPKLLSAIPPVDVVITMGCNVTCPFLPCKHREDWGLADPTGKPDGEFNKTIGLIEHKVLELKDRILTKGKNV